jgi:hypothetical protein
MGANAITTLKPLATLGLPAAFAVVDRAYTDQQSGHFAQPARDLGYRLALDYKVDQRGVQGSVHGALLIDGSLACPLIPDRLARATTGLDDAAIRDPSDELAALITAREAYLLRLKQPDNDGTLIVDPGLRHHGCIPAAMAVVFATLLIVASPGFGVAQARPVNKSLLIAVSLVLIPIAHFLLPAVVLIPGVGPY